MKTVKEKLIKYREIISYCLVGGCTTFVSLFIYFLCVHTFLNPSNPIEIQIANVLSWVISVLFAYFTNRLFVFQSKSKEYVKEMIRFFGSRIVTLLLDMALMFFYVTYLHQSDTVGKLISQVVVIITNYLLSKFLVFSSKEKKNIEKGTLFYFFVLLLPFIDFITSIFTWEGFSFSIGLALKGLLFLYALFYLLKNTSHRKIFVFLGFYFVLAFSQIFTSGLPLVRESINLIKVFYLPVLILFFAHYENEKITKKTFTFVLLFYLLLYIVPFFFSLGHNISEIYAGKELYLSYFYIGNELANVFILLAVVACIYIMESNSYLLKGIFALLFLLSFLLMSTKTYYGAFFFIFLFFLFTKRKVLIESYKKNKGKYLLFLAILLFFLVQFVPKMDLTNNIKTSLEHYEVNSISDLLTFQNIDHVLFSSRLSFLKNAHQEYLNGSALEKMLGMGRAKVDSIKNVEIDLFDIFYSIGIVGMFFYIVFFLYALKTSKLKSTYRFAFLLLLLISCFTGHVLISPFVSTFMALLFLVSKNDHGKMKKDILFVSNMYPSGTYPHYGIFVKNTYEILEDTGFLMDLTVMVKTQGKLKKLFAYIKLCGVSFWQATINNYDYIYVHFVSHTPAGVILPFILSKHTKLVLNVHGNDLVADTKTDVHYLKLTKFFLKFADVVICPSTYFSKILVKNYHIPKNKIVVSPSGGVNTTLFKKENKKAALKKLELDSQYKYFGYVARIEKDKGYDVLLEAISILKKRKKLKDIRFILVGSGAEEHQLEALIEKYNLKSYIIRKPLLKQEELVYLYNGIEALLYPTRRKSESLSLTGLEAMACETIVVGSNKYGPSDYLVDGKNSLTVDPKNASMFAKRIEEVLGMDTKEKNILKKEARKTSENYSIDRIKTNLLAVFKK